MEPKIPRTAELPVPTVKCPYEHRYTCDVAVVGCGFAGLNAAVSAAEKGRKVLVIDKGRPGYSGLSPWPSSFRWFDPERDNPAAFRAAIQKGGDYISNLGWYQRWIEESKGIFERLTDWGILAQYPSAAQCGDFYEREDFVGYREFFAKVDRHERWVEVLERYHIPFLEHTMVCEILTEAGKAAGVLGFHVPSGEFVAIEAKSVILATGGGSYKPTGYPTGGDTFDGEYMAYALGLPIAGKEFEDFHSTSPQGPGNVFLDNHWQYLENIWLCGGDVTAENAENYAANKGNIMTLGRVHSALHGVPVGDGSEIQDVAAANYTRRGGSRLFGADDSELRSGKMSTPVAASRLAGAATGMCCHLTSGVFCGLEDDEGATEIPGLFVAGDGIHATSPSGASYPCGVGFTSCFCSIDGDHAGKAAAAYAAGADRPCLSEAEIAQRIDALAAPLHRESGFDPNWARDALHAIMAPYWVSVVKSEETLKAALVQVDYMAAHVIPHLCARSGHDLRLCLEMAHKGLSAQLKLRASLERRESRGNTYRSDFPYRDDAAFLCYLVQRRTEHGTAFEKVPIPTEWAGDTSLPYEKRYLYYFPGEPEAKGFTPPEKPAWGKKDGNRKNGTKTDEGKTTGDKKAGDRKSWGQKEDQK